MDSITPIIRVRSCFFWVSALAIALISILQAIHTTASPNASSNIVFSIDNEIVTEVVEENYIKKLISLLKRIVRRATRHHHHPHHHSKKDDSSCDDNKWKSMIAQSDLRPSLVLTVDLMGRGNFTSVQMVVDAVPDNRPGRRFILFGAGVYREKVVVSVNKTNLTFQGQGYLNTSIAWNGTANSTGGMIYSASVSIFALNFIAYNISFG